MSDPILESLTPVQREAVEHVDGPLLVLAGPGSGKTRVVTHRIAHLVSHGIPAGQILALTFTNKAANEMQARLDRLIPRQPVWMGTFHRFCARLLRQHARHVGLTENYSIYDTDDSMKVLKRTIAESDIELTYFTPAAIANQIHTAKNNAITADQYQVHGGDPLGTITEIVYPAYQQQLAASNAVDFDDLLLHVVCILRENPELRRTLDARYRYILVDEYQDTNLAQYAIARALSIDHPNLSATGDPDQSIYGWRGANLNNILEFEADFDRVRVVRLEQNYRSTQHILQVADKLISHNQRRKHKSLFTENEEGPPVRLIRYPTHRDEADNIAAEIAAQLDTGNRRPRDFAILYRVNALSRSLEQALMDHGIRYLIVQGVEFYQRKEIKDVLAYLQLLNNPRDNIAFNRIVNTPPRAIGKRTLARLTEYASQHRLSLLDAARHAGRIESLTKRAAVAVAKFVALMDRIGIYVDLTVGELVGQLLDESGYHNQLKYSEDPQDQERLANIEELQSAANEFDVQNPGGGHLEEFLEHVSLVNDVDDWNDESDKVTLMTMHAAKGLEFPVVYIIAVEEGLLPHERSRDDLDDLEEERRLLFVGITRAEQQLQLSLVQAREFRGIRRRAVPSMFLMELPRDKMELIGMPGKAVYLSPDEYSQDEPTVISTPATSGDTATLSVTTAADLLQRTQAATDTEPVAKFRLGMAVSHPRYGLGKITALSGAPKNPIATIQFLKGAGQKKFYLRHAALTPADGPT